VVTFFIKNAIFTLFGKTLQVGFEKSY